MWFYIAVVVNSCKQFKDANKTQYLKGKSMEKVRNTSSAMFICMLTAHLMHYSPALKLSKNDKDNIQCILDHY